RLCVRILFATPAYWPAVAFGGPTRMAKELTEGLVRAGHRVDVLTTSLREIGAPPASRLRTHAEIVEGVRVHYLATPARYRWMGITPTLPAYWPWRARPDVVHVFGYRDVVTTLTAAWARALGIPYVFDPPERVPAAARRKRRGAPAAPATRRRRPARPQRRPGELQEGPRPAARGRRAARRHARGDRRAGRRGRHAGAARAPARRPRAGA